MPETKKDPLSAKLLEVQRTLGWMDIVLGNISDAVYVTDKNGTLVFANQFFSDLLSLPRVFLLGQKIDDVFCPEAKDNPQEEFLSDSDLQVSTEFSGSSVYEWDKAGKQYIFKISYRLIPTTRQTVYIAKDITSEHELSLRKSNFINVASHQLRTPMTAIMMYSHMLYDGIAGALDVHQKKLSKTIMDSSERMISLINDILLITRIQSGQTKLLTKDSSLIDALSAVEAGLDSRIKNKKLRFVKVYEPGALDVKCNRFVTNEILSNLITNAVQYTPEKGVISVSVEIKSDMVVITVADTGMGIPKKDLPTIFGQFSRAPNAMEVFTEGTGLGLYVVEILVTRIKGTINCESKLGKGTSFKVAFPV